MEPKASGSQHKTVSPARSRLQSHLLNSIFGLLLSLLTLLTITSRQPGDTRTPLLIASALSAVFAVLVLLARAATRPGALAGALVCMLLTIWATPPDGSRHDLLAALLHTGLTPLIALFVCTFAATRAGRARKQSLHLAEDRRGRRASQVLANLAVAASSAGALGLLSDSPGTIANLLCLAALVEATADTVSSEIGQAFGGEPRMLFTFRPVEPGTDGAVTLLGTAAGVASAFLLAIVGMWALHLSIHAAMAAFLGGVAGLFFDSLLGATVEQRGWLNNDLVNASSTLFAAAIAAVAFTLLPR